MLDSILGSLRVVALATKTDFRSVTSREVALFEGAHGWGEFHHFWSTTTTNQFRG